MGDETTAAKTPPPTADGRMTPGRMTAGSLGLLFLLVLAMPWSIMPILNGHPIPWGVFLSATSTVLCIRWLRAMHPDQRGALVARIAAGAVALYAALLTVIYVLLWLRGGVGDA